MLCNMSFYNITSMNAKKAKSSPKHLISRKILIFIEKMLKPCRMNAKISEKKDIGLVWSYI